jgi:gamma-glutamyltranspeptidase / glutathione hydrolase
MRAVVAAGHRASASAGARILSLGGNAVDAAVAAACAAAVCEGPLTGPGAGGFCLVAPPSASPQLLDFFVNTAGRGSNGRVCDPNQFDRFVVPFGDAEQVFHIGPASVAVPGMLQGLSAVWERFGRLPLAELVAPAVELARDGVVIGPESAYLFAILEGMLRFSPDAARLYAPGGRILTTGDRFTNPDLATTFEEFGRTGRDAMAPGGWLATRIVEGLQAVGGYLTHDDLAEYAVIDRVPLEVGFRGRRVCTNPPPSSGGILIAAALDQIDQREPATTLVDHYRQLIAAGEYANTLRTDAFARRVQLADPDAQGWVSLYGGGAHGGSSRGPNGTTHVSVMDADGMVVSMTSSNGSGSGVMLPGTGFLLNNMAGEQDLNPGGFGTLPAGTRMTSMMAPTVVFEAGQPVLGIGSAGSNRLRSAILQTLVGIVDQHLSIDEAVVRARVHPESGGIDVEGGIADEVAAALRDGQHEIRQWGDRNLFFGGVSAVGRFGSELQAAGDPRRGGGACGVMDTMEVVELSTHA